MELMAQMKKLQLVRLYRAIWKPAAAIAVLQNGLSIIFFLLLGLAAVFASSPAEATVMVKLGLDDLAREADLVLSAKVRSVWSQWDESGLRIYTYVALEPKEFFKGNAAQPELIVKVRGGVVGEVGQITPGAASFDPGEEVVVFLKETAPDFFTVVGMAQGKFSIERGEGATGKRKVMSNLSGIAFYDIAKGEIKPAQKSQFLQKMEYDYFREIIIEAVRKTEQDGRQIDKK